jgi:hypothetical protein
VDVTKRIIREARDLPIEDQAEIIDALLRTLNAPNPDFDREWVDTAKRRLEEIRSRAVRPTPWGKVLGRIRDRFAK